MGQFERVDRQRVIIPYTPRPQFAEFHSRTQRWSCIVAHRRAGKTVACINDLIKAAITCTKPDPRFAYIAPFYTQAKDVAWQYLKKFALCIPGSEANESELRVDLPNGGRIRLYGADNYDRMRGLYLDGVVLDEFADMNPRVWPEVIRPALSDRQGWATFIGTPKGRNGFYDIWAGNPETGWAGATQSDTWFSLMLKASETGFVAAEELADAQVAMSPEQYAQEYECSFDAAIIGAYYGKDISALEAEGRIMQVPWERGLAVDTAWDLGIGDATAVWFFQVMGREIRVIDYYEINNQGLEETVRVLLAKPYIYGTHYMPHDIAIRELISGTSRRDTIEGLGLYNINVGVRADPAERINAVRMMLPSCVFDDKATLYGREVLKNYRREWDDKRKTFRSTPLHDWSSHGADAFGEFAVNHRTKTERARERRPARIGHLVS